MGYKSDIEIAQETKLQHISEVARTAGIDEKYLEYYGNNKAKVSLDLMKDMQDKPNGKLILVTAITPTPAGEGKTTTTVGLGDALRHIGKKSMYAHEPSLGPVFGVKGGAAGGGCPGRADGGHKRISRGITLSAPRTTFGAAMLDNHIYWGNKPNIDPRRITWHRAVDINDRQLRSW